MTTGSQKEYFCPLGRLTVDLCDEPKFSRSMRFFLSGRQHLDEKDLLHQLVPEMMPPTFSSIDSAQKYANNLPCCAEESSPELLWFVKAVNQNGGRAVRIVAGLSNVGTLQADEQLQVHVPNPLLFDDKFKFHIKTYQHISCGKDGTWKVYMHDRFFLATASRPWSTTDLSDEAQITTMRTHRLYPDDEFRIKWNLTELIRSNFTTVMERVIQRGMLQVPPPNVDDNAVTSMPQFEVNSADWMLDKDGGIYLIECNGIPVVYDPTSPKKQALVTRGLKLYETLYHEDSENAVVNDSDLIQDALSLALKGTLPTASLWKHVTTIARP